MSGPQATMLGRRLHLNHGPIDLIIEAFGEADEVRLAYAQATARFRTILDELVVELPELRRPVGVSQADEKFPFSGLLRKPPLPKGARNRCRDAGAFPAWVPLPVGERWRGEAEPVRGDAIATDPRGTTGQSCNIAGPTALRMLAAVLPFAERFITPMAAVAGAVADEVLAAMLAGRHLKKAYVNNGGDSALFIGRGQSMTLAIAGTGNGVGNRVVLDAASPVRGVATSGWRGRSFSLGIVDAVTVLARNGAEADAAATIIANAVNIPDHPAIRREPANRLQPDSDLGERLVTTAVGELSADEIAVALNAGVAVAEDLVEQGLIVAAALFLKEESRVTGSGLQSTEPLRASPPFYLMHTSKEMPHA